MAFVVNLGRGWLLGAANGFAIRPQTKAAGDRAQFGDELTEGHRRDL